MEARRPMLESRPRRIQLAILNAVLEFERQGKTDGFTVEHIQAVADRLVCDAKMVVAELERLCEDDYIRGAKTNLWECADAEILHCRLSCAGTDRRARLEREETEIPN